MAQCIGGKNGSQIEKSGEFMKKFLPLVLLAFSMSVAAFDVKQSKFTAPNPASVCSSNEAMFAGASVVYSDCADDIHSIVATKIDSDRSFADLKQFISKYQPDGSYTDYDITDALFDGTLVAITPFDSKMKVTSNSSTIRFCLSDRTVYLVKTDTDWTAVTVLPK